MHRPRWFPALLAAALAACGDDVTLTGLVPEIADAGQAGAARPEAGVPPSAAPGFPTADTAPGALVLDVFESIGARYALIVNDEQLELMNSDLEDGATGLGDLYAPSASATFVDHLLVTTAGANPHTADFGQVQVRLVGESTARPWSRRTLPNFKIDTDEFSAGNKVGGVEHFRLNNAMVGGIFKEKLALDLYEQLGYPAARATYAWVSTNVWGAEVSVPYILVESYKRRFCEERATELGGECRNIWEYQGDINSVALQAPANCQLAACDPDRAIQFANQVFATPQGPGYQAGLQDWLDWPSFHEFQCSSWILETGDDALHSIFGNNLVLVERGDGKFQHLPYSVDISFGQANYDIVPLPATSLIAQGCQSDPACWSDTIATCETLLERFEAADPVAMLDRTYAELESNGMLRSGDEGRYQTLREHLAARLVELPTELELNRDAPYFGGCPDGTIPCGDTCALAEDCPPPEPDPIPDAGLPGSDAGLL